MSKTQKITTVSIVLVLMLAVAWIVTPRKSHQIVIKPAVTVQR